MHPLPILDLESPDLIRSPIGLLAHALHIRLDYLPVVVIQELLIPPLLEEVVRELVQLDKPRLALDFAEDFVVLLRLHPVESPLFGTLVPARRELLDIDVGVSGGVGIFLDIQCKGGILDCLANEPANTLLRRETV